MPNENSLSGKYVSFVCVCRVADIQCGLVEKMQCKDSTLDYIYLLSAISVLLFAYFTFYCETTVGKMQGWACILLKKNAHSFKRTCVLFKRMHVFFKRTQVLFKERAFFLGFISSKKFEKITFKCFFSFKKESVFFLKGSTFFNKGLPQKSQKSQMVKVSNRPFCQISRFSKICVKRNFKVFG